MNETMSTSQRSATPIDREIDRPMRRLALAGSMAVMLMLCEVAFELYALGIFHSLQAALIAEDTNTIESLTLRREKLEQYGWLEYVFVFGAVAAFFTAMHGARRTIEWLGMRDWKWSYGWTAATFFMPFVNLVRPWLGLGEIDRAIAFNARQGKIDVGWRQSTSGATVSLALLVFGGGGIARGFARALDRLPEPQSAAHMVELFDRLYYNLVGIIGVHAAFALGMGLYLRRQYRNLRIRRRALAAR